MHMRLSAAVLCLLAFLPASSLGRTAAQRALWATVNVCDTIRSPDRIGIRGSMPGNDHADQSMWMRFRVQYYDAAAEKWKFVRANADSGFTFVGTAKPKALQAGILFQFKTNTGSSFQLRGQVTFQWRKGGKRTDKKVLRTVARLTTAGHHSNAGSDPKGYSSDTCVIS